MAYYYNENPTATEKILFEKYGLYLVNKETNLYQYAPIHLKEGYAYVKSISVDTDMVEWEHSVIFDIASQTVKLNDWYDSMFIELIEDRMKDLNFQMI